MLRAVKVKARGRSTTSDILGTSNGKGIPTRWAGYYQALIDLRERLRGDRTQQSVEAREEQAYFSEHIADAGTDSYDRDWALAMASSTQNMLYEVEQAIIRIRDGSYGFCEMTGQRIETERLRAIPWTRFSASAQAELESRGAVRRAQLGQLAPLDSAEDEADHKEDETVLEAA